MPNSWRTRAARDLVEYLAAWVKKNHERDTPYAQYLSALSAPIG